MCDSMMHRQVNVHLNFVFLKRCFRLKMDAAATIGQCLDALRKIEPELMKRVSLSLVFDDQSRRLSLDTCLLEFGEVHWVNLIVT